LFVNNDSLRISETPLEDYFTLKKGRILCGNKLPNFMWYNGYLAHWIIKNDSLFLSQVEIGWPQGKPTYFDIKKEFGTDFVFAKWYSGDLTGSKHIILLSIGVGAYITEGFKYFFVTKGKIDSTRTINYIEYDKNKLYPGLDFLYDTIKSIIVSNINSDSIRLVPNKCDCYIKIEFDSTGKINSITNKNKENNCYSFGKYIQYVAENSIKTLPPLMKVTNPYYFHPPTINLYFESDTLKRIKK
jgi:hypothetical protein